VKVRIQFEKRGAIRFTSHKDVLRIFERALAAGGVPVAWSEGFHPHMRMSFGPPLKTGWESLEEYMDVQLESPMDDMAPAVNEKLPDGLCVTRVVAIDDRTPKLAVDIVAVELEAVMETEDVRAAGGEKWPYVDTSPSRPRLSRILPTPSGGGEPAFMSGRGPPRTRPAPARRRWTTVASSPGFAGVGNDRRSRLVPRARQGHASRAIRLARRAARFTGR
jgi:hypothetical protein